MPAGSGLRNRAGAYRLSLPSRLANGEISVRAAGQWVAFAPLDTAPGVEVSAAGAMATYTGAWPGVDLQYTATANTVKEALVVDSARSMRDFSFTLRVPEGSTLTRSAGGGFTVRGASGRGRLDLAAPFMIDAAGSQGPVAAALSKVGSGWHLTLRPDRAWLADSSRRWPVTVDPQVQVNPSRDCDISDLAGGDCSDQWLEVGWYWERQLRIFHALLAFDVASAVPQGNRVVSARLRARGPGSGYMASRVTAAWDGNVDWEQRTAVNQWATEGGDYDGGVEGVQTWGSPWTEWDVTTTVRQWVDGVHPNYGLLIQDPNLPDGGGPEGGTNTIDSSESSNPPYLEIVHEKRDIVHARAYDAAPSVGGDELADEYVQLSTRSARRSAESAGYHAQTVVPCAADADGCLESRSFDATQNIYSTVLGTSAADDRVGVSEVIDAVDDAVGAPLQTGSIGTVLAGWQTPPPGHGPTFELYETTEDAGVNGADVTIRERVWLDAATRLPLRQQVLEDTTVVEEQFYSYTSERLAPSEVAADFFRPGPPPGAQTTSYTLDPPEPEPAARASDPEPQRSRSKQLAAAEAFREAHGLSTSRALMESLLDDPPENATIVRFGVPLTDQELAEMETRLALQRSRSIVDEFGAEETATYAGSYMDHRSGGVLRVGFTEDARAQLERLRAAFPYPGRLRAFSAERTLSELRAIQRELQQDAQSLRSTFSVQATSIDESENQVVAGDAAPTVAQGAALRARYGDAVRLVLRDPVLGVKRVSAGNRVDLTEASNFNCTLNFGGFRRSAGKKYYYQLSAGHCLDDFRSGYTASYSMPVRAPFGRIGRVQGNHFPKNIDDEEESGNTDSMAIFLLPQSRRSSRIRLETRSGRTQYFRVVDRLDDMREGDTICQYGHETGFTACGEVDETNVSDPQGEGTTITSLVIIDMFDNCTVIDGDSGGPVFDSRPDGVLAGALIHGFTRSTLCGEDPEVEGSPAQDAAGQRVWVSPLAHALDAFGFNLTVAR